MKKVLILGVGNAQLDAIRYCQDSGYEVFGISYRSEGRGKDLVDHFAQIDIVDREGVLNYTRENKIDLVYSVGSDIAMPVAGYVAKKLGLPYFIEKDTAELLQNKGSLGQFLLDNGLKSEPFICAASIDDIKGWDTYPAMMKPIDSQGQRGVFKLENAEDACRCFAISRSFSRSGKVIIEKCIDGSEVSVNAFVVKGEIVYSFITDRLVVETPPIGIPRGHKIPSKLNNPLSEKVRAMTRSAIEKLRIKNGPVYLQLKYNNDDVNIIEIAGRLDGCHIWRLIKSKFGIDLMKLTFELLTNESGDIVIQEPYDCVAEDLLLSYFLQKPNEEFKSIDKADEKVLYTELFYKPGQIVRPINGYAERVGYKITKVSQEPES